MLGTEDSEVRDPSSVPGAYNVERKKEVQETRIQLHLDLFLGSVSALPSWAVGRPKEVMLIKLFTQCLAQGKPQ